MESEWSVIANVKAEAFGRGLSPGTKHFVAGTKIWAVDWYWGMGGESVRVLGRHRGARHLILLTMSNTYLTNWRAKVTYHPHVVNMLREHHAVRTQAECEDIVRHWTRDAPPQADLRDQIDQLDFVLRLLRDEPRGRVLAAAATAVITSDEPSARADVLVLADWLADQGASLPLEKLCVTLKRRHDNNGTIA